MNELFKYTDDKKFVRWVLNPTEQLDSFWNDYKEKHPEELEQIQKARTIVLQLKSKKEKVTSAETENLFAGIMDGIEAKKKLDQKPRISRAFLGYAAAAVFIILIGIKFYFSEYRSSFLEDAQKMVVESVDFSDNSQLVLANNRVIELKNTLANIQYLNTNQIVIDQKDTVSIDGSELSVLNQLLIPHGNNAILHMSDGTKVYLNAGSRFIYPPVFDKKKRSTFLEGEAFFEVKHNQEWPFVAATQNMAIEVLGTRFNLSAYPVDGFTETFLVEGSVRVKQQGFNFGSAEKLLAPMQSAVSYSDGKEILVSDIDDSEYISWYKGYLNFKSKNLETIVKKLERHFNVVIKLNDPNLGAKIISGKLKLKDVEVETVVKVLATTAELDMQQLNASTFVLNTAAAK
ncbi:FecR domain-containing protein [uncultured Draconibacterium sp.]|uniref:FecR family protein n=1 Tax=uncultured Draconibacterium sp. TaxID=1573823 RepID=UPI003216FAA3